MSLSFIRIREQNNGRIVSFAPGKGGYVDLVDEEEPPLRNLQRDDILVMSIYGTPHEILSLLRSSRDGTIVTYFDCYAMIDGVIYRGNDCEKNLLDKLADITDSKKNITVFACIDVYNVAEGTGAFGAAVKEYFISTGEYNYISSAYSNRAGD